MNPFHERAAMVALIGKDAVTRLEAAIVGALEARERVEVLAKIGAPRDLDERAAWESARNWLRGKFDVPDGTAWTLEIPYANWDKDDPAYTAIGEVWRFFSYGVDRYDDGPHPCRLRDSPSAVVVEAPAPAPVVPVVEPEPEAIGPERVSQRLERGEHPTEREIAACTSGEIAEMEREYGVKLSWAVGDTMSPHYEERRDDPRRWGGPW